MGGRRQMVCVDDRLNITLKTFGFRAQVPIKQHHRSFMLLILDDEADPPTIKISGLMQVNSGDLIQGNVFGLVEHTGDDLRQRIGTQKAYMIVVQFELAVHTKKGLDWLLGIGGLSFYHHHSLSLSVTDYRKGECPPERMIFGI